MTSASPDAGSPNGSMRSMLLLAITVAGLALSLSSEPARAEDSPTYIKNALKWVERPPIEFSRDDIFKPADILTLGGVRPGMVAVDLMPNSGYYTRILSAVVGPKGHVYAVIPQSNSQGLFGKTPGPLVPGPDPRTMQTRVERVTGFAYQRNVAKNTDVIAEWVDGKQYPNDLRYGNFALPQQVDFLITAYAYHIFKSEDFSNTDMSRFLAAVYRGMNNGGTVVVVDNVASPTSSIQQAAQLNRVDPELVKREMQAAGFEFIRASDTLTRSGDDRTTEAKDPILDRSAMPADAFVLIFRKPRIAPNTNLRPANPLKALAGLFGNTMVVGNPPDSMHLLHEDYTYQEIRGRSFDSGIWFFNADGWNCRYRPGTHFSDCATTPHEYEHQLGDKWEAPHGHYEIWKGYDYSPILKTIDAPPKMPPGSGPPAP